MAYIIIAIVIVLVLIFVYRENNKSDPNSSGKSGGVPGNTGDFDVCGPTDTKNKFTGEYGYQEKTGNYVYENDVTQDKKISGDELTRMISSSATSMRNYVSYSE